MTAPDQPRVLAMTGATGFVGGATLQRAVAAGWQVRALTRRPQQPRDGVTWIDGALDRPDSLAAMIAGADAVLHIAGVVNVPTRAAFEAGNAIATANVVAAARDAGVARFVHVSSLAAREPALSNYGWSKERAEAVVMESALDWTIIRPPAVFGPGDTDMLDLFRMVGRGIALLPPPGRMSAIYVDELAQGGRASQPPRPPRSRQADARPRRLYCASRLGCGRRDAAAGGAVAARARHR